MQLLYAEEALACFFPTLQQYYLWRVLKYALGYIYDV